MRSLFWIALSVWLALLLPARAADVLADARSLASNGQRPAALDKLEGYLKDSPEDPDARLLYGLVLSWESRYEEARKQLGLVLAKHPDYLDATKALINVELWDGHPGRAEALAVTALSRQRRETSLMIAQVRALRAQNHNREALDVVRNLLDIEPFNEEALSLDRTIKEELQQWSASFSHTSDWFKGGIGAWNEYDVTLKRATYLGSVSATFSRADRFGLHSNFSEVTWYPRIRPGTYGYVGFGFSNDGTLFPYYRLGAEIFQTLPHGMEVSGGYRRFGFSSATDMYTGSLGKYYSNWLFTGRFFLTPDALGATHSESITARRYFGDHGDYIGLRVGTGPSPFDPRSSYDLQNLSASSGYIDVQKTFGRHWVWTGLFGVAVEQRLYRVGVDQFTLETTLNYRF